MIADVDCSQKVVPALALSESGSCSRVGNSAQRLAFKRRPADLGVSNLQAPINYNSCSVYLLVSVVWVGLELVGVGGGENKVEDVCGLQVELNGKELPTATGKVFSGANAGAAFAGAACTCTACTCAA